MDRKSTMISEKASVNSNGKKEKSVWENNKRQTNFFLIVTHSQIYSRIIYAVKSL